MYCVPSTPHWNCSADPASAHNNRDMPSTMRSWLQRQARGPAETPHYGAVVIIDHEASASKALFATALQTVSSCLSSPLISCYVSYCTTVCFSTLTSAATTFCCWAHAPLLPQARLMPCLAARGVALTDCQLNSLEDFSGSLDVAQSARMAKRLAHCGRQPIAHLAS